MLCLLPGCGWPARCVRWGSMALIVVSAGPNKKAAPALPDISFRDRWLGAIQI